MVGYLIDSKIIREGNKSLRTFVKMVLSGIGIMSLCLGSIYLYLGPLRALDIVMCEQQIGSELNIEPRFDEAYRYINKYLNENLHSAMDRDDVIMKFKQLGPIKIESIAVPHGYRDTIFIKYCLLPINYIRVDVWYDHNKRLINYDLVID